MSSRNKGICFIILSAFSFALMGACVRLAGDVPSIQKSFFRNLVAFFVALIMIVRSGDGFEIKKGNLGYMVGTLGILCNFYAVDHLVLSDASMLNKMSPFFVILFSFLLLKEKLKPAQAIAIFVAFIGSLFIIKPTFTNMELFPSVIGLCGGIGAGIAYAMVRILGQRGQKGSSVVLFFSGFSCIETLPYLLFNLVPGLRQQEDNLELPQHIIMHLRKRYRSMIIHRLFSLRFSDTFFSDRFRTSTVCWDM